VPTKKPKPEKGSRGVRNAHTIARMLIVGLRRGREWTSQVMMMTATMKMK
jgi:hypothetical protein